MTSYNRTLLSKLSFPRRRETHDAKLNKIIYTLYKTTHQYYVYLLASKKDGVLYIGVTNDLERRIGEHKSKIVKGFTTRYNVDKLVYFEEYANINKAIKREKQLKKWNRQWKVDLIEKENAEWKDLAEEWEEFNKD